MRFGDLIASRASCLCDKTAVIYNDKEYSYAEIDANANSVAAFLRANGIGVGNHVVYIAYNSEMYFEILTACSRIGAVFTPISWRMCAESIIELVDATELIYNPETTDIEFVEPAAGGKIMAVITIPVLRPQVGTIRPGTFKYVPTGKKAEFELVQEHIDFDPTKIRTKLVEYKANEFDPELDIASCDTIVCVGNGVKDESLPKYKELAKLLGGKLAGTRPVCDRELLPVKLQVGQSGVMIKPKLYIGFGVSGAVNHVTGVDAEKFIAVNKDASAPIFNYCDYGIVGDMDEVCDAMIAMLKN